MGSIVVIISLMYRKKNTLHVMFSIFKSLIIILNVWVMNYLSIF